METIPSEEQLYQTCNNTVKKYFPNELERALVRFYYNRKRIKKYVFLKENNPKPYLDTGIKIFVCFIPPTDLNSNPFQIRSKYFNHRSLSQFFINGPLPYKTRHTYTNFLNDYCISKRKIVDIQDKNRGGNDQWAPTTEDSEIAFSQMYIHLILDFSHWGNPNSSVSFVSTYNNFHYDFIYGDLIDEFTNCLFYQNSQMKQTWQIRLSNNVLNNPIPTQFYAWFQIFSPTEQIFPEPRLDLYKKICFFKC